MKELWKTAFRMSAETFQILVDKVSLRMQKQDTRYRNAFVVHKRVAIAVWRLATALKHPIS